MASGPRNDDIQDIQPILGQPTDTRSWVDVNWMGEEVPVILFEPKSRTRSCASMVACVTANSRYFKLDVVLQRKHWKWNQAFFLTSIRKFIKKTDL
jgi:hypothetical protein